MDAFCMKAFAEALEVVPYTLAENAGLNPINMVTEVRRGEREERSKELRRRLYGISTSDNVSFVVRTEPY